MFILAISYVAYVLNVLNQKSVMQWSVIQAMTWITDHLAKVI